MRRWGLPGDSWAGKAAVPFVLPAQPLLATGVAAFVLLVLAALHAAGGEAIAAPGAGPDGGPADQRSADPRRFERGPEHRAPRGRAIRQAGLGAEQVWRHRHLQLQPAKSWVSGCLPEPPLAKALCGKRVCRLTGAVGSFCRARLLASAKMPLMKPQDESVAAELTRLRCLCELRVLDSAPEAVFDALARLAATLCNTPVALVSLLDRKAHV